LENNSKKTWKIEGIHTSEIRIIKNHSDLHFSIDDLLGKHKTEWNTEGFSAGTYFLTLETNGIAESKKACIV